VVHTGTASRLELRLEQQNLRIEVEDRHPGRALPTGNELPGDEAEAGRGLLITSALAAAWGVEYTATSKRVWVLCDRDGGAATGTVPSATAATKRGDPVRVAVLEVTADGVVSAWNADATTLFGWTAQEAVGRRLDDLIDPAPGDRPPTEHASGRSGRWQGSYSVVRSLGPPVEMFASHMPSERGDGSVVLLVPVEQRALLEHPPGPARVARTELDPLGLRDDALLRLGVDEYLALAVERVRDPVSADATYLLLAHDFDEEYEVVAVSGLADGLRGTRLHPGAPGVPDARTPHLPVVVPDVAEFEVPLLEATDLRSLVVVPVVVEGRVIGALAAAAEHVHGFSDEEAVLLQRFADSIAVVADRARLRASERERRDWLSFIADSGDLLAGSLDQDMTMAITGQIVVPRIARWCAIHLNDERGQPVLQQVWHEDEKAVESLRAVIETTGPQDLVDRLDDAVTAIPLVARGRQIGFLTVGRAASDPLGEEFFLVAESIARRAALAIDNAHAHGELQAVGRALQQSLLPASIPAVPGLDVGVVYEPAGEASAAGGDFYDLFPVGGGRWCFVVGDVCGTGAEAAAVTGLARHTIQALVRSGFPIAAALERLNSAILDEGDRARFLTLVCGTLERSGSRVHMQMVNAGHPPPFVVERGGQVHQIGSPQSLLGVVEHVTYAAEDLTLGRGDLMVAVTDGVLERRNNGTMLGEAGLAAELIHVGDQTAQAVAERVRRRVLGFTDAPQRDDMAILAIRVELGSGVAETASAERALPEASA
jgi:serine phosphatase RsbU (regulator of sigma subunit)